MMRGGGCLIVDQIENIARASPGRSALMDRDQVVTFGQLREEICVSADLLSAHGAGQGHAVWGLLLSNRAASVAALLGIARTGSAAILFPPALSAA